MIEYRRFLKMVWYSVFPKQRNRGRGSVQVGQMRGNVTVINHHHAPPRPPVAFSPEHAAVLDLMKKLENRVSVLEFMQREFGTKMVKELQPHELFRLRRYVEVVIEKSAAKRL